MGILIDIARTERDLQGILDLQQRNLVTRLDANALPADGFVTVEHDLELLQRMNAAAPHVIAKAHDQVVAYALTMLPSFRTEIPLLVPMFDMIDQLHYQGQPMTSCRYYIMGQVCVDESQRGKGIFDGLYAKHCETMSSAFDLCVTEISERNPRSIRAHERAGFTTLHTYRDTTDIWRVVVWDWRGRLPSAGEG